MRDEHRYCDFCNTEITDNDENSIRGYVTIKTYDTKLRRLLIEKGLPLYTWTEEKSLDVCKACLLRIADLTKQEKKQPEPEPKQQGLWERFKELFRSKNNPYY